MNSEIKILCNDDKVCPEVMLILQDMGFERLKDVSDSSPSFDITARCDFQDYEDRQETITKIFDICKGKIQQIQLTRKSPIFS